MLARLSRLLGKLFSRREDAARLQDRDTVFDTAIDQPRDLDDPFSDPQTQARVARVIADKASKNGSSRKVR